MTEVKEQIIRNRAEFIEKNQLSKDGITLADTILKFICREDIHHTMFGEWKFDNPHLNIELAKLIEGEIFGNDIFTDEMTEHVLEGGDYIHVDDAYEHVCDNPPDRY